MSTDKPTDAEFWQWLAGIGVVTPRPFGAYLQLASGIKTVELFDPATQQVAIKTIEGDKLVPGERYRVNLELMFKELRKFYNTAHASAQSNCDHAEELLKALPCFCGRDRFDTYPKAQALVEKALDDAEARGRWLMYYAAEAAVEEALAEHGIDPDAEK
jgi:hypothetical protein